MGVQRWCSRAAAALVLVGAVTVNGPPVAAAVPDRAGFALYSGGVVSQASPAGTTVVPIGFGRWQVRFPGQAAAGGVVHVTAVHPAAAAPPARWCQATAWGPSGADQVVRVSCHAPGGALSNARGFSVMFSRSSGVVAGGHYGYLHSTAAGGIVSQYNSAGAANGVIHAGVGFYSVSFPGLGTPGPNGGSLQVTAVSAVGARCKVAGWSSAMNGQHARIVCHNGAGALSDTRFTVSYQFRRSLYGPASPPHRFGYLWNIPPLGPALTGLNSSGAANLLVGANPWTAVYPNIAASPGNVQVTASGSTTPEFCNVLRPWTGGGGNLSVRINCFTNAGVPVVSGFFASYSSRF